MTSSNTYKPKNQKDFDLLSKFLEEISLRRFVKATPGTKIPGEKWKNVENHYPNEVGRDSLIRTGKGLMIIDVDKWEKVPQDLQDFLVGNPTFTVQSPHAEGEEGHYYYKIDRAPFPGYSKKFGEEREGGEYKHGSLSMTPGSEITDCQHGCCSYHSPGEYRVRFDHPIRSVTVDELPIGYDWSEWGDTDTKTPSFSSPPPERTKEGTVTWDDGLPDKEEYEVLALPDDYDGETVTNGFGMSMQQIREISGTIDRLCDDINPSNNYRSPSEADFHYCQTLYYWGFDKGQCQQLLSYYRSRRKLKERDDYGPMTVQAAKEKTHVRMDAEFAYALYGSCGDEGPAADWQTLTILMGHMVDYTEWTETKVIAQDSHYDYRRVLRGLHILADAGRIKRRGRSPLEWRLCPSSRDLPYPP